MGNAARIGDMFVGVCSVCKGNPQVSGIIISGSGDYIISGNGAARVGDIGVGSCGHSTQIVTGSPDHTANGQAQARVGDLVAGQINGQITIGAPTVTVN